MKITRVWAMPNKNTFSIKPIGEWVKSYLGVSKASIDPFARDTKLATVTNDLNTGSNAGYHLECEEFLSMLAFVGYKADLIILDPPYSPRQVKECYDSIGRKMAQEDAMGGAAKKRRRVFIEEIATRDATVLTFGWNTNGMGKGWKITEILLVAHGSDHNDTICMAETRE